MNRNLADVPTSDQSNFAVICFGGDITQACLSNGIPALLPLVDGNEFYGVAENRAIIIKISVYRVMSETSAANGRLNYLIIVLYLR